jgi:hypothetical protein
MTESSSQYVPFVIGAVRLQLSEIVTVVVLWGTMTVVVVPLVPSERFHVEVNITLLGPGDTLTVALNLKVFVPEVQPRVGETVTLILCTWR